MEGKDPPGENIILIDNELSALQKFMKAARLRIHKAFCSVSNIFYIVTFICIVFLISFWSISQYRESKTIAILRGLVSEKKFKMDLNEDVLRWMAPIFTYLYRFQCFDTESKNYPTGSAQYNYTVCPQITESYEFDDDSWEIDIGKWDGKLPSPYYMDGNGGQQFLSTMYYNNGATEFCADRNTTFARNTVINYFCRSLNLIDSVNEWTECSYMVILSVNCTVGRINIPRY